MGGIDLQNSPQLRTAALMDSSLRQSVVPVIAILGLGGLIGCLTYFALAPAPISRSAAVAVHPAKEAPSTVGQGPSPNALIVIDRQRQLAEEIASGIRQAAYVRRPVEVREAATVAAKPAFDGPVPPVKVREAAVVAAKPAFDGPVPLPRRRPLPRP